MTLYRPLQPQFKLMVYDGNKIDPDVLKTLPGRNIVDNYLDITPYVAYPVTYEEHADLLNTVSFTVNKNADILLYYFFVGQKVMLHGKNYYSDDEEFQHVFSGTVTRLKTSFTDSGAISFTVECMNYGFTKFGKDKKHFVYPDKNSTRKFAQSEELSLYDLIKGIAEENNYEIGVIDLSSDSRNVKIDKIHIRYQKNMSDWKFLIDLARDFGCTVWFSSENGVDKINFASFQKAMQMQSDIVFLFPLYGVTNKQLKWDSTIRDSEVQFFPNSSQKRPRILKEVQIDEDISLAYSVSRTAMYYDKETGDYKESVSMITTDKDGRRKITFYELDEERVKWVKEHEPDLYKKICNGGPTSMEWGDDPTNPEFSSFYYTAKTIYDEQTAVFDRAFFGITVTAKCNQDLNIRSQRTYRIRGVLSYHSKDLETSFFLRGLKQIWDSDGAWTELDFIR